MLENKLGITSAPELAEAEERISKKKAIELFENSGPDYSYRNKHSCIADDVKPGGTFFRIIKKICKRNEVYP